MVLQTLSRCLMRPNLTNTKLIRPLLRAWLCCALKLRAVMGFGSPAENLPHMDLGRSMSQGLITTKTEYLAWCISVMQTSWRLIIRGEYHFMLLVFILFPWLLATVGNKSCVGWVLGPGMATLVLGP